MRLISIKLHQLNLRKDKLKFSVTVTLKKNILDPQGKVVENTLEFMNLSLDDQNKALNSLEDEEDE